MRLSESVLARMHFVIYTRPGATREYDVPEIEARLVEATRSWVDDLGDALVEHLGEERGTELFALYRDAFPAAYRDDFTPEAAVLDVERMERLDPEGDLAMTLYRPLEAEPDFFVLKLLRSGQPILLSDVLPLLEDMGVKVFDERPYEIDRAGPVDAWIYDFGLTHADGAARPRSRGRGVQGRVRAGVARRDRGRRVQPPRAQRRARPGGRSPCSARSRKYLRQAGSTFSQTLHGGDPGRQPGDRRASWSTSSRSASTPLARTAAEDEAGEIAERIEKEIDAVASLDDDRILRSFLRLVQATLRTNYFQLGDDGQPKPYLSFKFDPALVPDLPLPRPMYEIWVLLAAHGGRPPARREGRPRRHPLVGPPRGLPHRDPRADEGADGQERRDRPGGREGRLRRQAAAGRPRRAP